MLNHFGANWALGWWRSVWMLIVVPYHSTFVAEVFVSTWDECSVGNFILADGAFRLLIGCRLWLFRIIL